MKQFLYAALLWAMCSANAFADGAISINSPSSNSTAGWTYAKQKVTITKNGTYTITGTTTTNRIKVASGITVNITLSGVNINVSEIKDACAFDMDGATVTLTLAAGTTNKFTSGEKCAGLAVPSGAKLTIGGSGTLEATGGDEGGAGIGGSRRESGGNIVINSGRVTATGGSSGAGIGGGDGYNMSAYPPSNIEVHCGVITINGGTVTATGKFAAAGIGSGRTPLNGNTGGKITINGGTVTATGECGAGIGSGMGSGGMGSGGTIVITGGTVTATGEHAAGIGGSAGGAGLEAEYLGGDSGGNITISGGRVTATGKYGAGIGGGNGATGSNGAGGSAGTIIITGGTVTATGDADVPGIGGGKRDKSGVINTAGSIKISGGSVKANLMNKLRPTDDSNKPVYCIALSLSGVTNNPSILMATIANVTYQLKDVTILDGNQLYFWLPVATYTMAVLTRNGYYANCSVAVAASDAGTATLSAPTGECTSPFYIDIAGVTVAPKIYDGTTTATVNTVTFSGLVSGESLTSGRDYTATATFSDASAGSGNKTVTVNVALTAGSAKASMYTLNSGTYTLSEQSIAKKSIAIANATVAPKTYDGTTTATVNTVTFDGLVNGESLTFGTDYTVTGAFDDASAGSGNKTGTVNVTLINNSLSKPGYNYTLGSSEGTFSGATISQKEIAIDSAFVTLENHNVFGSIAVDSVWFEGLLAGDKLTRDIDYTADSAVIGCICVNYGTKIKLYLSLNSSSTKAKNYTLKSGASPYSFYDQSSLIESIESTKRVIFVVGMNSWPLSDVLAFLVNEELKRDNSYSSYEDVTRSSAVQRQVKALRRCEIAGNSACLSRYNLLKWSITQGVAQVCLIQAQGDGKGGYTFSAELFSEQGLRTASCTAVGTSAAQLTKAAWDLAGLLRKSAASAIEVCRQP